MESQQQVGAIARQIPSLKKTVDSLPSTPRTSDEPPEETRVVIRNGNLATIAGLQDEMIDPQKLPEKARVDRFKSCLSIVREVELLKQCQLTVAGREALAWQLVRTPWTLRQLKETGRQLANLKPESYARPLAWDEWLRAMHAPLFTQAQMLRSIREAREEGRREGRAEAKPSPAPHESFNWVRKATVLSERVDELQKELELATNKLLVADSVIAARDAELAELKEICADLCEDLERAKTRLAEVDPVIDRMLPARTNAA